MNPKQAITVLDKATQPGFSPTRGDYVAIHNALVTLSTVVDENEKLLREQRVAELAKTQAESGPQEG